MRNDALDICYFNIEKMEKEIITLLIKNNIDEKIILDIIEIFYKYFKIILYN